MCEPCLIARWNTDSKGCVLDCHADTKYTSNQKIPNSILFSNFLFDSWFNFEETSQLCWFLSRVHHFQHQWESRIYFWKAICVLFAVQEVCFVWTEAVNPKYICVPWWKRCILQNDFLYTLSQCYSIWRKHKACWLMIILIMDLITIPRLACFCLQHLHLPL